MSSQQDKGNVNKIWPNVETQNSLIMHGHVSATVHNIAQALLCRFVNEAVTLTVSEASSVVPCLYLSTYSVVPASKVSGHRNPVLRFGCPEGRGRGNLHQPGTTDQ